MRAGGYHDWNPSAARLAAIHESTSRIIALRILIAVLLVGWLAMVGWAVSIPLGAISAAFSSAASNIKFTVQNPGH